MTKQTYNRIRKKVTIKEVSTFISYNYKLIAALVALRKRYQECKNINTLDIDDWDCYFAEELFIDKAKEVKQYKRIFHTTNVTKSNTIFING